MSATYDGSPCSKGHGTKRYKANGTCVVCNSSKRKSSAKTKAADSTRYFGSVCSKHPELDGLRLSSNYTCVYCHRDRSRARQKNNGYPVMKRQVELLTEGVYKAYGQCCTKCGNNDRDVLTIDHVDQKGSQHKSNSGTRFRGIHLYRWLKQNNYPPGFRTLCINCNVKTYKLHKRGEES